MKTLLVIGLLLGSVSANAGVRTFIFTPGQAPKVVLPVGNSYQILDMGGGPTTGIYNMGSMSAIIEGGEAKGIILNNGGSRGIVPAYDMDSGDIDINLELEDWQ